MISFQTFFKQRMARFFLVLFASLLLLANIAVYLIANVQYNKQIERQETSFITMLQHLITYESIDTAIVYVEHYDHTHRINIIYKDALGNVLYQSETAPISGRIIPITGLDETYLGEIEMDYQQSILGQEVTWGLILFNGFSLILFFVVLLILYRYLNRQNELLHVDLNNIGKEDETFRFIDISQINERYTKALGTEHELKEMQKHYVQILAHDIKTPLTILKANLEGVLLKRIEFNEMLNHDLLSEITTIEKLVPQFIALDMSQIEKSQNIGPIIRNKLSKLDEVFKTKQMILSSRIDDLEMKISAVDVTRIVEHLVFNAFYYSHHKGVVRVVLDSEKKLFSVKDSGIGMTNEEIELLKNGPYRSEASIQFNQKGSGIGMQIVFDILKRINAEIHIQSEKNVGTTIEVRFESANKN